MSIEVSADREPMLAFQGPLQFRWQGWDFEARLEREHDAAWLRLRADLGPVPYSLENPARRRAALSLHGQGRVGRFAIDPLGNLNHYAELRLENATDLAGVITALVKLLWAAKPAYARAAGWPAAA